MAGTLTCLDGKTGFPGEAFWILVDQLSWVKMCSGEVSQHYITTCHCIRLRKVSIRGLIQVQMVSIWTGIYGRTVFPGFEESNQMVT